MLMTGLGALAAAIRVPAARASLLNGDTPAPPPLGTALVNYIFQDDFDGPAASAPDPSKWLVEPAREPMRDPTAGELFENVGQYRDDRRNVFLDGNSNLVFRAVKDGNTFYSGKVFSKWRGGIGHTWEARIKLNCLTPGCWPAWYLSNDNPVTGSEVDIMEWYGKGNRAPGTAVHAKLNGGEHSSQTISVDGGWHTWRCTWDDAGMRFWKDYVGGAQPYLSVPAHSLRDWQFNDSGYQLSAVLDLAVAGSGGGDPRPGTYPADMLIDWVRVW
jgi:hypothetical protein